MKNKHSLLIVEDDRAMRDTCIRMLSHAGYQVEAVGDGEAALEKLQCDHGFTLALVDLKLPKMNGVTVLKKIKELEPDLKVVIMTGYATVKSAVETMKLGATDYIVKPFEKNEFLTVIARQLRVGELERKVQRLESELRGKYSFDSIVGRSRAMKVVFEQMMAAGNNKANVLIVGESGTGKELVARGIHYNGQWSDGPFVPVNCAALPETLIESELFGHTKGAFTGATQETPGLFRAADGGTIFLDEVFEVSPDIQVKLLRTIQELTVRPVGAQFEVPVGVRIVAATNRDPAHLLKRGSLRKDLFYRLSVITICVPTLRERREDISHLVEHFTARFAERYGFRIGPIDQEVMDLLGRYSWPGNVRELENLVERWFAMGHQGPITPGQLPAELLGGTPASAVSSSAVERGTGVSLQELEKEAVRRMLEAVGNNKTKAASLLGISRKKLYKILREW